MRYPHAPCALFLEALFPLLLLLPELHLSSPISPIEVARDVFRHRAHRARGNNASKRLPLHLGDEQLPWQYAMQFLDGGFSLEFDSLARDDARECRHDFIGHQELEFHHIGLPKLAKLVRKRSEAR